MNENEIADYLTSLGLGQPLVQRGVELSCRFRDLVDEPILHVFADDYRDEDGSRHFEDLWVFFERYACEHYNWTSAAATRGDISGISPGLTRVMFDTLDFDLGEATDASRLVLDVQWSVSGANALAGKLKASGKNCETLAEILRAYVISAI